jgi:hypothetical protein
VYVYAPVAAATAGAGDTVEVRGVALQVEI